MLNIEVSSQVSENNSESSPSLKTINLCNITFSLRASNLFHCTLHFEGTKPYVLCTKCSVILWDEFAPIVLTE